MNQMGSLMIIIVGIFGLIFALLYLYIDYKGQGKRKPINRLQVKPYDEIRTHYRA